MALRKLSKLEENTEQWFYEIKKVTVNKRRKLEIVIIGGKMPNRDSRAEKHSEWNENAIENSSGGTDWTEESEH